MSDPAALPPVIAGKYRPLRILGRGGMGTVYVVEHANTGEQLALKVMNPDPSVSREKLERFKREARVSAIIKSEHIVRMIDADVAPELQGAPFLVMELLEGNDLARHCGSTPQPPAEVLDWLRQLAWAMDKAHALGLVHRDLKPENLFLTQREGGTPLLKILDFGLVKSLSGELGGTRSGEILGTPLYMAPEQARGQKDAIGPHTDLWAIGLIAFRLLAGKEYWSATSIAELIGQICYEPMPAASARGSHLGPAFDAWFARACAREPRERFPSAHEMIEALAVALDLPPARPSTAPRSSPPEEPIADTLEASPASTRGTSAGALSVSHSGGTARRRAVPLALGLLTVGLAFGGVTLRSMNRAGEPPEDRSLPPLPSPSISSPSLEPSAADGSAVPSASSSGPPPSSSPSAPSSSSRPDVPKKIPAPAITFTPPAPPVKKTPRPLDDQH